MGLGQCGRSVEVTLCRWFRAQLCAYQSSWLLGSVKCFYLRKHLAVPKKLLPKGLQGVFIYFFLFFFETVLL